jgi:hypothetical protein
MSLTKNRVAYILPLLLPASKEPSTTDRLKQAALSGARDVPSLLQSFSSNMTSYLPDSFASPYTFFTSTPPLTLAAMAIIFYISLLVFNMLTRYVFSVLRMLFTVALWFGVIGAGVVIYVLGPEEALRKVQSLGNTFWGEYEKYSDVAQQYAGQHAQGGWANPGQDIPRRDGGWGGWGGI